MQPALTEAWIPAEPDVMELEGRLDTSTAPAVEEDARLCIQSGARRMVLDCRNLFFISGIGLQTILTLAHAMQKAGGRLILCNLQPQVREMVDASGLEDFVPVYEGQSDAFLALTG